MFNKNKSAATLGAWDGLCQTAGRISKKLKGPAQDLFEGNLVVQAEMMRALSYATYEVARCGLAVLNGEKDRAIECLKRANSKVKDGWKYCVDNGNRGVYENWYTMSNIMNLDIPQALDDLADRLAGKEPKTQADRERIEKVFSLPKPRRWR